MQMCNQEIDFPNFLDSIPGFNLKHPDFRYCRKSYTISKRNLGCIVE